MGFCACIHVLLSLVFSSREFGKNLMYCHVSLYWCAYIIFGLLDLSVLNTSDLSLVLINVMETPYVEEGWLRSAGLFSFIGGKCVKLIYV